MPEGWPYHEADEWERWEKFERDVETREFRADQERDQMAEDMIDEE